MPYENIPEHIETAAREAASAIGFELTDIVKDTDRSAYRFVFGDKAVGINQHFDRALDHDGLVQKLVNEFSAELGLAEPKAPEAPQTFGIGEAVTAEQPTEPTPELEPNEPASEPEAPAETE